ncbi:DEAD/DEAH box helicase [Prochlorococcus sp. MIT 0916]|uniref:DEAD/DEAH box helicase n=1 Tax=Prochlorococcus sp. MIT 0916 TaxID=3082521 RepID=UPI0039B49E91
MTTKNPHEESSCPVEQDVLEESTEEILDEGEQNSKNGFSEFNFSEELIQTISNKGYSSPTPIQKAAIPELLLGRDLVGQAQTGTGKTAAFALPILERLKKNVGHPQVLVLAPTRELAMQVAESFRTYSAGHPHFKVLAIYGGSDFRHQINTLRRGVDVVVGTPGRVMDHMRQKTLNTSHLSCLVLDEADEMLRMGFIDDVEWILEQLPEERQLVLFSATMPSEIRRLSKKYLNSPAEITIKATELKERLIRQRYISVQNVYKVNALQRVLEAVSEEGVIIFARTKAITIVVAEKLESFGYNVAVLNGDIPQNQRERTVERLRQGSINILVATDVAARGLDVDRIGLVINYDMPFDREAYVHRIGRTGRAGRNGEAILFVNPRERSFLSNLERAVGQPIEKMDIPDNELINSNRIKKLQAKLIKAASTERDNPEESNILEELIKNVEKELDIDPKDLTLAALNLAVGFNALLENGNEDWIRQSAQRNARNDRRDNKFKQRRRGDFDNNRLEDEMDRFRVEVGHRDRVKPGNLVGAIANEAGLKGRSIGRIRIFENYSLVDLPKQMPDNIFQALKKVKVMNRELQINRAD